MPDWRCPWCPQVWAAPDPDFGAVAGLADAVVFHLRFVHDDELGARRVERTIRRMWDEV